TVEREIDRGRTAVHEERIAIAALADGIDRTDRAAAASTIFDHEFLPQSLAQLRRDDPHEIVRAPARREWDDDRDRTGWVVRRILRLRHGSKEQPHRGAECDAEHSKIFHPPDPSD